MMLYALAILRLRNVRTVSVIGCVSTGRTLLCMGIVGRCERICFLARATRESDRKGKQRAIERDSLEYLVNPLS